MDERNLRTDTHIWINDHLNISYLYQQWTLEVKDWLTSDNNSSPPPADNDPALLLLSSNVDVDVDVGFEFNNNDDDVDILIKQHTDFSEFSKNNYIALNSMDYENLNDQTSNITYLSCSNNCEDDAYLAWPIENYSWAPTIPDVYLISISNVFTREVSDETVYNEVAFNYLNICYFF